MKEIDEDGYAIRPNKTQIKRDLSEFRLLSERLVELPVGKLMELSLDSELISAVNAARKMKKSALQRQLRYITGMLKNGDSDNVARIQKQYEIMLLPQQQANTALHQLEAWRDNLIEGDESLLNELVSGYGADRQYLRQLVRNIQKDQKNSPADEAQRLPKAARVLFKYLQDLLIRHEK